MRDNHDTDSARPGVPPVVNHRLNSLEDEVDENAGRIDAALDDLRQIKYVLFVLAGMAAGDMFGLKELISTLL
jgi:hypothetical protein